MSIAVPLRGVERLISFGGICGVIGVVCDLMEPVGSGEDFLYRACGRAVQRRIGQRAVPQLVSALHPDRAAERFNADLRAEHPNGDQRPMVSVLVRDGDGVRHFYSQPANFVDGTERGIDLLSPVWNVLDLLPRGRGDWYAANTYPPVTDPADRPV